MILERENYREESLSFLIGVGTSHKSIISKRYFDLYIYIYIYIFIFLNFLDDI